MFKICKTIQDYTQENIAKAGGRPSHNYIKRTGAAGNYKYWYKLPNGHVVSSDKDTGAPHVDHSKEMDTDERHVGSDKTKPKKETNDEDASGKINDKADDKSKYIAIGFLLGVHDEYENIKSIENLLSKLESDHITGSAALDFLYNEAPDDLKAKIDDVRDEYGYDGYDENTKKKTPKKESLAKDNKKDGSKVKKSNESENIMDDLFKTFRLTPTVVEYDNEAQFSKGMDSYTEKFFQGESERIAKSTSLESVVTEEALAQGHNLPLNREELIVALHLESMFKRD